MKTRKTSLFLVHYKLRLVPDEVYSAFVAAWDAYSAIQILKEDENQVDKVLSVRAEGEVLMVDDSYETSFKKITSPQ
jgi:hypothetical protein